MSSSSKSARARMAELREVIARTTLDSNYAYRPEQLIAERIEWMATHCGQVLDVGRSSREHYQRFAAGQAKTLDINDFGDYPDIIDDICQPQRLAKEHYDGIICLSVLEHVYDPQAAVSNLHQWLQPGGRLFLHAPFLFRYHAPPDLNFADCYRFSRDGLAWLLRDFSEVTLYPVRGRFSSMFNLQKAWKKRIEARFGMRVNRWLDRVGERLFPRPNPELQVSGYYAWAIK